jgi:phenylalanyl-tRNA synthetase alpha chain
MNELLKNFLTEVEKFIPSDKTELEAFRVRFLGRKGILQDLFDRFRELSKEDKAEFGKIINQLKDNVGQKINDFQEHFKKISSESESGQLDLTLDATTVKLGSRHPVSIVKKQMIEIFSRIGFTLSEGPEIVDDWHNFSALNFPDDHPAKDMQDTFYIQRDPDVLLRTHTSPVQVKVMQSEPLPIRTISVGRVYRNETITYKSHIQFHQVEGLYVDKKVTFADMKQALYYFVQQMFGKDYKIRFRPSYFPFTEPSAEMDISPKKGETKWMEILGCGMVDPQVLDNCGIDSTKYTGYAFGIGIERIALLKYHISDIRVLYENDVRFLEQFIAEK